MNTIQQLEFNLNVIKDMYLMGAITEECFKKNARQAYEDAVQEIVSDDPYLAGEESVLRARSLTNDTANKIISALFPKQGGYEIL